MGRSSFGVLLVVGQMLCLSPVACSQEAEEPALCRAIGQKIIVGFFGQRNSDRDFRRVLRNLEDGVVGGILFLGRNISNKTDLEAMVHDVKNCKCAEPALIAIDEEGGVIERLSEIKGFGTTPSAAEIGRGSEGAARIAYRRLAKKLFEVGFNMNIAPVVDLNINPANPVIGQLNRSFSSSPQVVSRYAKIFIEEHHKRGIATVLKHFPGHGSSLNDSHDSIVDVEKSWSPIELVPYENLIGGGMVDCVMVGHLANGPRWGGPATQDPSTAIEQMLRQNLKFNGV